MNSNKELIDNLPYVQDANFFTVLDSAVLLVKTLSQELRNSEAFDDDDAEESVFGVLEAVVAVIEEASVRAIRRIQ